MSPPSAAPPRSLFEGLATLLLIVRKSLAQHALSSGVTVAASALGVGLVLAVFGLSAQSERAFTGGSIGFDAVLGARGSALQLVLNTVYHLETSPGNLPWSRYVEVREDPLVELAIPYAVGDSYRGFRVVGTTEELFSRFEYREGETFTFQGDGEPYDPERREAVVGASVARRLGLGRGSHIRPEHGVGIASEHAEEHDEEFVVTGVLEPTNTPSDRVIWIPIEGVFRMDGHVLRGTGETFTARPGQPIPEEHREVSAVLLKLKSPQAGFQLDRRINGEDTRATLAFPIGRSIQELFDKLGWVNRVLEAVAYLVCVVAAGAILASLTNAMNERRHEFAVLRALGARRRTVFAAIVLESSIIAGLGALLGFVVYALLFLGIAGSIEARTGVLVEAVDFHPVFVLAPLGMFVLGALAGLVPAWKAYATDVATHLAARG